VTHTATQAVAPAGKTPPPLSGGQLVGRVNEAAGVVAKTVVPAAGAVAKTVGAATGTITKTVGTVATGTITKTLGATTGAITNPLGAATGTITNPLGATTGTVTKTLGATTGTVTNTLPAVTQPLTQAISKPLAPVLDAVTKTVAAPVLKSVTRTLPTVRTIPVAGTGSLHLTPGTSPAGSPTGAPPRQLSSPAPAPASSTGTYGTPAPHVTVPTFTTPGLAAPRGLSTRAGTPWLSPNLTVGSSAPAGSADAFPGAAPYNPALGLGSPRSIAPMRPVPANATGNAGPLPPAQNAPLNAGAPSSANGISGVAFSLFVALLATLALAPTAVGRRLRMLRERGAPLAFVLLLDRPG